jgi:hypothetical protein
VAFGGRADAVHGGRRNKNRCRISGRHVVHDLVETKDGVRNCSLVKKPAGLVGISGPHPFVGFAGIVQPEVVVHGLRREDDRQTFRQRLQSIERAVATNADESFDSELAHPGHDHVQFLGFIGIHKVPRGADQRAAFRGIQLRNRLEQGIEVDVRNAGIEEAVEALDQSDHFDL